MHMNVWDYCINKVRAEIPNEILTEVFSIKNNTTTIKKENISNLICEKFSLVAMQHLA